MGILLEVIGNHTALAELRLPIIFQTIVDAGRLQKSRILRHLDMPDTIKSGLTLAIGELSFGPGVSVMSSVYQVRAEEFIERYGDTALAQQPVCNTAPLSCTGMGAPRLRQWRQ